MPIYNNKRRISKIYYNGKELSKIYQGAKIIWSNRLNFKTSSWADIKSAIDNGTWKQQGWKIGDIHLIKFKDNTSGILRIIGINDGRETQKDFIFQSDKTATGEKAHLTLELTSLLPTRYAINPQQEKDISQTWGTSNLYTLMRPNGEIYENLPDNIQSMILPVIKKTGASGQSDTATPLEAESYLFPLSMVEYLGASAPSNANSKEGAQYEYYSENLQYIPKRRPGSSYSEYYYTRSPVCEEGSLYDYQWAIGSSTAQQIKQNFDAIGVSFAFCI